MKTLKDEIVEALRDAAPYLDEKSEATINKLAAKVESARCDECSIKDELLKEMAEAIDLAIDIIDMHGIPVGFRGSGIYNAMQKYKEQVGDK